VSNVSLLPPPSERQPGSGPRYAVPPAPTYDGDSARYYDALTGWLDAIRDLARSATWLRWHARLCGYRLPGDLHPANANDEAH
jgi:hypothetical protein